MFCLNKINHRINFVKLEDAFVVKYLSLCQVINKR